MNAPRISFGDKVRIRVTNCTKRAGIAGQVGTVYGFTNCSQTGMEVVGDTGAGPAIAVMTEGQGGPIWLGPELLEFVDHQPGTTVRIGNRRLIRDEHGQWHEVKLT